jgi:hypothetical protein
MSRLLKAKSVAEILGVSAPTVRAMWERRELQYVELPGAALGRRMRRTSVDVLERFIAERSTPESH